MDNPTQLVGNKWKLVPYGHGSIWDFVTLPFNPHGNLVLFGIYLDPKTGMLTEEPMKISSLEKVHIQWCGDDSVPPTVTKLV